MTDGAYLLTVVGVTSAAVYAAGRRWGRLSSSALPRALRRLLEYAGLAVAFYALNLATGFVAGILARRLLDTFVSAYVNSDTTLPILSALQAAVFQWWRAEGQADE